MSDFRISGSFSTRCRKVFQNDASGIPRRSVAIGVDPTCEYTRGMQKTATLEQHMDVQSAIHARDCAHASTQAHPRAHRERCRNRLPPRLRAVGRRFDGGPCRPGVRDEDDRGGVASVAPRAAAARPLRSSLPLAAAVARGSEITALSTPQMRPVRPLLRVGVRPRTCPAGRDGIRRAGRACGAMEKGLGRPRVAWMRARRAHRFIRCGGLLVALGDLLMASGMAPAMKPKALLSPAVSARANKKRSPHHPPTQLSR